MGMRGAVLGTLDHFALRVGLWHVGSHLERRRGSGAGSVASLYRSLVGHEAIRPSPGARKANSAARA